VLFVGAFLFRDKVLFEIFVDGHMSIPVLCGDTGICIGLDQKRMLQQVTWSKQYDGHYMAQG
jgi:hypothetical protein